MGIRARLEGKRMWFGRGVSDRIYTGERADQGLCTRVCRGGVNVFGGVYIGGVCVGGEYIQRGVSTG